MNVSDYDVVCLSHLRWDFVYQRPHHLMSRFARERRVFFVEEPVFDGVRPILEFTSRGDSMQVVTPHLPEAMSDPDASDQHAGEWSALRRLLDTLLERQEIRRYVLWYYTPMALEFSRHLSPAATIYDCMDELSAFNGAPPRLRELERELFRRADLVFTGGESLYAAKRASHHAVHLFPSSVDVDHFSAAREVRDGPEDQRAIPHPRVGFFGVIDERLDVDLLREVAALRPDWQFVLIGPVVETKVDPDRLPRRANIHYLGAREYRDLPRYLGGWDVAMLPFARNEATRFISPTKTPEYLAAGRPVVSTGIRDVVRPYGLNGLVRIANGPVKFAVAVEQAMRDDRAAHARRADAFLRGMSWDRTWEAMRNLVATVVEAPRAVPRWQAEGVWVGV